MAMKKKKKTSPKKKAPRLWGFLVGNGFTPGGFSTRVSPPYFKTEHRGLAGAIRKAKGTTELTPIQMEEYEAAQLVLNPDLMRERLKRAVIADEAERSEAEAKAARDAAAARTSAQAAEQRAAEAADRVAELEAAKKKAETVKTGIAHTEDADLFDDGESAEGGGLTLADLDDMNEEELIGVLTLYSIPVPTPATRAVVLRVAQEAVKGNILKPDFDPEKDTAETA